MSIQVQKDHYYKSYDDITRFILYYYQIDLIRKLDVKNILEIGIGNKTVTNYLKQMGYNVTTCDIDPELVPDSLGDVRMLPFRNDSFDLIVCSHVLEHTPWDNFPIGLQELHRVTSKYIYLGLPYSGMSLDIIFSSRLPVIKEKISNILIRIPYFFQNTEFDGEHYWEIGRKGTSYKTVKNIIKKYFNIREDLPTLARPYFHNFILEKCK